MLTFSDIAIMLGCIVGVLILFGLLLQKARERSREQVKDPRSGWRRVIGLGGIAASPLYGWAFPLAAVPAVLALFKKAEAGWPRFMKALVVAALAGILLLWLSALGNHAELSGNVLHYAAFALFATAAVKVTSNESSAAQLLGYAAIGSASFFVIFRPSNTDTFEHMWKYGLGPYVAIIAVWAACSLGGRVLTPSIALIVVGCASLFLGFRSHGLVCFVVAVFLIFRGRTSKGKVPVFRSLLAGGALFVLYQVLPAAIESGVFGQAVQQRTLDQIGEDGPALLAGRVEPPLSIAAIGARWLFGWGNLNNIDSDTISHGANIAYQFGLIPSDYMRLWIRSDGRVSVHSLLGEGWSEGGILAALLPLLLLCIFLVAAWKAAGRWSALVLLVCVQGIWDVLFSTWGYNRALTLAFSAVLAAWAASKAKTETAQALGSGGISDQTKADQRRPERSRLR